MSKMANRATFIVRAKRDIAAAPVWVENGTIPEGELLLAVEGQDPHNEGAYWHLFPLGGPPKRWHLYVESLGWGLGVAEDAVEIVTILDRLPPISDQGGLSDNTWVLANTEACLWLLRRHGAIAQVVQGLQANAEKVERLTAAKKRAAQEKSDE